MGERYAGEEDFCATSTALVARANVCTLWAARDHHRILAELRRCSHPTTRAPWVSDRIETGGGERGASEGREYNGLPGSRASAYLQAYRHSFPLIPPASPPTASTAVGVVPARCAYAPRERSRGAGCRVTQVLPTWEAAAEGAGEAAPPEPDDGPHPETGWPAYPQVPLPPPPGGGCIGHATGPWEGGIHL